MVGWSVGEEDMVDAWRYAVRIVGMSTRPNRVVEGGAGAYFAALRRVGWKAPSAHSLKTQGWHRVVLRRRAGA